LYSPPYLTDVAELPCETEMFQKSYKLKNTSSIEGRCSEVFLRMYLLNFFFSSN